MFGLSGGSIESFKRIGLLLGLLCLTVLVADKFDIGNLSDPANARLFQKPHGRPSFSGTKTPQDAAFVSVKEDLGASVHSAAPRLLSSNDNQQESTEKLRFSSNESGNTENEGTHESGEALIVYIVAIILVIGGACREIKKLTGLPYTPQLLLVGILLGTFANHLGTIGAAFRLLLDINPHGILMIFIPTIIFESAYNSDPFTTKRQIWQILLLAGPGVIVGAILITLGFNFGLGYYTELSFTGGLTFGAIVCATDPVAVVALLKELGTPVKFNMLLEGESLLNDGTAMVFYLVFSSIYKAQGVTLLGIIWKFLQLSVGGILLGAVTFVLAISWIRKIVKDEILTIAITFMACYLAFFIGETYLGVSGILAIVSLGVLMSMYGKVRINPESEHSVHVVWSFIQYTLETVIFVLTGGYIGFYTLSSKSSTIVASDWIRMVLFYFVMTLARYLMIQIFTPIMNKTGYPVTQKDILVLTYGGLRGAIALCLGLIVYGDNDYTDRFKDLVLFYLAGMITLTVLFNGLTMKWLMKKIEFTPPNLLRDKFKQNLEKHLVVTSIKAQQKIKDNRFLQMAAWDDVYGLCGTDDIILAHMALKKQEEQEMRELMPQNGRKGTTADETMIEIRYRVYRLIKAQFWTKFEENFCSSAVVTVLNESIDMCMDDLEQKLWVYECISESLISGERLQNLLAWRNTPVLGKFARSFLNGYLLNTYEMLSTLIVSLEELLDNKPMIPLSQQYVNIIFGEVQDNKNKAEQQLFALTDQFPELIATIQTKQAAHIILVSLKKELEEENHSGSINDDEFAELVEKINYRISRLDYKGLGWEHKDIQEFDVLTPFFKQLDIQHKDLLKENHNKVTFAAGQPLYQKDHPANGIYILSKGLVEDSVTEDYKCKYGLGSIMHWINIVTGDGKARTTVTALKDSSAIYIQRHIVERIFQENKEFEEKIYKASLLYLVKLHPPYNSAYKITDDMVVHLQANCTLVSKGIGEMLNIQFGGFLVSGELKTADDEMARQPVIYRECIFISPAGNTNFKVVKPIKLLRFSRSIMDLDEETPAVKKSFMAVGGMLGVPGGPRDSGLRKSSVRGSFQAMMSKEKDVEALFEEIVRQKFKKFHN